MKTDLIWYVVVISIGFVLGWGIHWASTKTKFDQLEASRDWWRERALGQHAAGLYPPHPDKKGGKR